MARNTSTTPLPSAAILALALLGCALLSACPGSNSSPAPDTMPPTFAGAASLTALPPATLRVSWAAATDNASPTSAIVYKVYRGTGAGLEDFSAPLGTTVAGATSFDDATPASGIRYYYVVRAVDGAGNEDTNTVEVTAQLDFTPPTFNPTLTFSTPAATTLRVSWSPASDLVSPQSTLRYRVYRGTAAGTATLSAALATTAPGATSYDDTAAPQGQDYYVVHAVDEAGNEDANTNEFSTIFDYTAPAFGGAASVTAVSQGLPAQGLQVAWAPATDNVAAQGAITYQVFRSDTPGAEVFSAAPLATTAAGATSYNDTSAVLSSRYYYVVRAVDALGNVDANTVEVTAPLEFNAPIFTAGVASAIEANPTSITLAWLDASDDVSAPAAIRYRVYRAVASGGQNFAAPVATTQQGVLSYTDSGLTIGIPYFYVVRAVDEAGNEDANTVEATATPVVRFTTDLQPIFTATCATSLCHTGPAATGPGLDLSAGNAYVNLVGTPPGVVSQCLTQPQPPYNHYLVTPGSSATSYLINKLTGSGICFPTLNLRMPRLGVPLQPSQIDMFKAWIDAGAPNN
jgi:fibronectin type 3 domain-containing protein